MKILIQNGIDGFGEVQLSALAAFQSKQTDGGLSKHLGGGWKKAKFYSELTSVVKPGTHILPLRFHFYMLLV